MKYLNHNVVLRVCPDAIEHEDFYVTFDPDTEETELHWRSKTINRPSDEALTSAIVEELAYQRSIAYIALRQSEYPPVEEYLDAVVKGDQSAIDTYINKCLEVKAKYPKGA